MEILIRAILVFLFNPNNTEKTNNWSLGDITLNILDIENLEDMNVVSYSIKNNSNGKISGGKDDTYSFAASLYRLFDSVR